MPPKYNFDVKTAIEHYRVSEKTLSLLKSWYSETGLPTLSDQQFVLFLISCDNEVEETMKTIRAYFKYKKTYYFLFTKRLVTDPMIAQALSICEVSVVPRRTPGGSVVLTGKLTNTSFYNFNSENIVKLFFLFVDLILYSGPPTDLIIVVDAKGFGLMHLTKLSIRAAKALCFFLQEGLPTKLKEFHFLNSVYYIDKVLTFLKPFMSESLFSKLYLHPSDIDMEMFYEKYVPKECLPEDFGGLLPKLTELNVLQLGEIRDLEDFFKAEEEQWKVLL